ncbi:ABC transporter permease [Arsenicicoccus dermatophilus]|uniref:ABC transporter permease n=1 Tax=Arsenicicoccus dermatophilus TaxID=1076331 RepID=UPI0039170071
MTWLQDNLSDVLHLLLTHAWLAAVPLVVGLLIALPLGWVATRLPWLRQPLVLGSGLLYTIPSLALFILMPLVLGTRIVDPLNVVVAMTIYTVALLVRTVVDGLGSVPEDTRQAATAMGIGRVRRLLTVELPLAIPVIAAGLRVAAVSNVSILSVAALIGQPQLGVLFTDGFAVGFLTPIVVGIVACVLLALAFDAVITLAEQALTPWRRGTGAGA